MDYEQIRYEVEDSILTITLDRPDRRNAFTPLMGDELVDAFTRASADDDVRVVVLTAGGSTFCPGADFERGDKTFDYDDLPTDEDTAGVIALAIYDSYKPVIVAFNGAAAGVGVTMTLPADVRLASTTSKFGFVFVRRGVAPEAASTWFLPRLVGVGKALEWNVTGRLVSADEALRYGLVTALHEPDELLPAAYAVAREIVENTAPVSVALTRRMIWTMLGSSHPMDAHNLDSRVVASRGRAADAMEGVVSFLEKRPPRFPDRVSQDLPSFVPWWEERSYEPPPGGRSR